MPVKEVGEVISNTLVTKSYYHLVVQLPCITGQAKPGQFAHVLCNGDENVDPLLRRPLSFHWVDKPCGYAGFLYQVVGKGTRRLSQRKPGDLLDVIGPLGNGFPLKLAGKRIGLVGGGMGVAPLLFLTRETLNAGGEFELTVFIGTRSESNLVAVDDFCRLGVQVQVATDDGSYGRQGTVTALVGEAMKQEQFDHIIGCGPHPMLKALQEIATRAGVPCHISLEERMACGVGACRGCVVKRQVSPSGNWEYANVCDEGPVFDAREVVLR
ncbi:MAG: dihydroorotate dehydrogenase electron transfer subunit [Bacillota bacterium]